MPDGLRTRQWLHTIGKERIQAFQDAFARSFGISLCLIDLNGKALTVWSNSSLFCHYMVKKNRNRCYQEHENAVNYVLANRKSKLFNCYMGLAFFMVPIFCGNDVICLAHGGGVINEQAQTAFLKNYNVRIIPEKQVNNLMELLAVTLNLLQPNECTLQESKANIEPEPGQWFDKHLSKRECEIAGLVCSGLTNKQIAGKLYISEKTVKTHVSNILTKLDIKDRLQLAISCRES